MHKIQRYLLSNYSTLFFQLFTILYAITSIIFLVKIATDTSLLKITFLDLGFMYLMQMPLIIFFAAPISFFAAATINLVRFSLDSELVVLFSIGVSPNQIVQIYLKVAALISATLLVLSLGVIPITQQLFFEFISIKKYEAKLNVKSTEFGQSFGEWLLFVNDAKDNLYKDVVMMSLKGSNDQVKFITSESTEIDKIDNIFTMKLKDGDVNLIGDDKLNLIQFDTMHLNDIYNYQKFSFLDIKDYWKRINTTGHVKRDFISYVLVSIFPIVMIFMIMVLGVMNPRVNRNFTNLYLFFSVLFYFSVGNSFAAAHSIAGLVLFPIVILIASYFLYRKRILSTY
jgi:lipopolysaccharide export system permease protein